MFFNKKLFALIIFFLVHILTIVSCFAQSASLQSWSGLNIVKNLPIGLLWSMNPETDRLLSGDGFWRSYSLDNTFEYYPNNSWDIFASLQGIYTYQEEGTNSLEIRPYFGTRYNLLKPERRTFLYFQVRYEFRFLHYYDSTPDEMNNRLRLSTMARYSLNRNSNLEDKNLMLRLSGEHFSRIDDETEERFAFKYIISAGLYYRHSYKWRYEFRYQIMKSRNSLEETEPSSIDHILYLNVYWFLE
jgi:hypothetical protein